MQRHKPATHGRWRWGRWLAAAGLAALGLFGCNHLTWDDITSRDFKFEDFYAKPQPPLVVLAESKDGNKRGNAFRELKEPKLNGGTDQDQDTMLSILATAAKTETSYYARLQAMRKLGEFKDPRAVPALDEAYFQAESLFPNDGREQAQRLINTFRCEVLRGMGNNDNPAGVTRLVAVLTQPPPGKKEAPFKAQLVMDERMAAARALAHFPQYKSTEALLAVLKTDQDVALRDVATTSLHSCTGKDLPADYATWDDYLHHQPPPKNGEAVAGNKKGFMELIQTAFGGGNK